MEISQNEKNQEELINHEKLMCNFITYKACCCLYKE